MTIESEQDLEALKRIGQIVGQAIGAMAALVRPGISTAELDEVGGRFLAARGARSAPQLAYHFPGVTCISINDEAAHGIPGERIVQPGDLVNIDISAELNGYYADAARMVMVPPVRAQARRLCACSQSALYKGMAAARAGQPLNGIGRAVEAEARRGGFTVLRNLPGHGVGRSLHEEPTVLNFYHPHMKQPLREGMVLTIEPFLSNGAGWVVEAPDGWTLKTPDGSLSAQYEHTLVITRGRPLVITAAV